MRIPVKFGIQTYQSRHPPIGSMQLLNMRVEALPTDDKSSVSLVRNEGVTDFSVIGAGSGIRGMRAMRDVLYAVADQSLYRIAANGTATLLGAGGEIAAPGPVFMEGNGTQLVIVNSAGLAWVYHAGLSTLTQITDPDFPLVAWVFFFDHFFVFGRLDGTGWLISALADPTQYDPLDIASAESSPDDLIMGLRSQRDLLLFGTDSLEFWYNAGLADFPFDRAPDGAMEIGCAARHSVAKLDNSVFWLAREKGGLSVRRLDGRTPARISTPVLDDEFDYYTKVDDAIGQAYNFAGHAFYLLTFPTEEVTWCYDVATQLWQRRSPRFLDEIDGELTIFPDAVLAPKSQTQIGVLLTPNGHLASGGVVGTPASGGGLPSKALVSHSPAFGIGTTFQVRVHGTDVNATAITEDIAVATNEVYRAGATDFYTYTGVTLLSSGIGSDGGYCVGLRKQESAGSSGFNQVRFHGAIALRAIAPNNTPIPLEGLLSNPASFGGPIAVPDNTRLFVYRHANSGERNFSINGGAGLLTLPAGEESADGVTQFTGTINSLQCTDTSGIAVFADIGALYREAAP